MNKIADNFLRAGRFWTIFLVIVALFFNSDLHPAVCQSAPLETADAAMNQPVDSIAAETIPSDNEDGGINFLSLLMRGGWFMLPLLALSVIVVAIAIERSFALRVNKIFPARFVRALARLSQIPGGLDPRAAFEICQKHPSTAASIFKSLLVKVGRPQAEIEHAVAEAAERQTTRLLQPVSWLGLAAAIAPLIGLLGTVWGITQAFYDTTQLVAGQNRAEALAEGIYTALVTTMFGLIIAIPAAVLAHFFESRVVTLVNQVEEMIFNLTPQLERYEGRIRFSDVVSQPATNTAGDDLLATVNESTSNLDRGHADSQRQVPK